MARKEFVRDRLTWASYWMLGYFAFMQAVLGPLMPFIRHDLHLSYTVASLHFSAFALGSTIMGGLGERIATCWGRHAAFWRGSVGMACGALLVALSPVVIGTVLGAFVMGLLGALLLITIQAVLADRHVEWRAVALTEANIAASVCAILASAIVGVIAGVGLMWRFTLVVPILGLLLLARMYRSLPLPRHRAQATASTSAHTSQRLPPLYWIFACLIFFDTGVEWCIAYWGASFLVAGGRISAAGAATALSLFFLGMVIGRYVGSRLSRRFSGLMVVFLSLCIALLGFPLFWLAPTPALHVLGLFIVGLGVASIYPQAAALAMATAPEQTDRASSRLTIAGGGAVLVAPVFLGALSDRFGIGSAFGAVIPLLLAALASVLVASRVQHPALWNAASR